MPGLFVTFEGIDGSGKSRQARLCHERLSLLGFDVILTREPGGSPGAEEIRSLLVQGGKDRWSPETELILFNAARRDHVERRSGRRSTGARSCFVTATSIRPGDTRAVTRNEPG